jgi:hypothetical protein
MVIEILQMRGLPPTLIERFMGSRHWPNGWQKHPKYKDMVPLNEAARLLETTPRDLQYSILCTPYYEAVTYQDKFWVHPQAIVKRMGKKLVRKVKKQIKMDDAA